MGLYIGTTPIKKVFVADGSGVAVESNKTVNPSESQTIVTPDTNYDALAQVTVNAVSSSYVGSGITRRDSTDLSASGATVSVPSGYYASNASKAVDSMTLPTSTESSASSGYTSKATVSRSTSDQYINIPTGYNSSAAYYKVNAVANGTAGTPTATKGTVSNHSISVTPSVTNTTGYITGSTKTGTAVTVSASELVSGSETKTSNGTYDVTNLAELVVNVSGGGTGLVYETGTYTPTSDIARPTITFANTHTEAPVLVFLSDVTGTAHSATNSNYVFTFVDPYKLWGEGFPYTSSGFRYAVAYYSYRSSSTSSLSNGGVIMLNNSDSTTSNDTSYPRYWASPTDFHPYSNSSSRYWRSGRTYKWIAVWKPTT